MRILHISDAHGKNELLIDLPKADVVGKNSSFSPCDIHQNYLSLKAEIGQKTHFDYQ